MKRQVKHIFTSLILSVLLTIFSSQSVYALSWTQSNTGGFGDSSNNEVRSLAAYGGNLYAGTYNPNGAEVWQYEGSNWTQVANEGIGDADNLEIYSLAVYGSNLYAGTQNTANGSQVWKYNGSTWSSINTDGFGDANNTYVYSQAVYGNNLYAGTRNDSTGAEVWEYSAVQVQIYLIPSVLILPSSNSSNFLP